MPSGKRLLGISATLAALVLMGYGAYKRIKAKDAKDDTSTATAPPMTHADSIARNSEADLAIPVEGAVVRRGDLIMSISAAGDAAASQQVKLSAQTSGKLLSLPTREGDFVVEQQEVATVDSTDAAFAVQTTRMALARDSAAFHEATLFDDHIPNAVTREAHRKAALAQSGIEGTLLTLSHQLDQLKNSHIRTPIRGMVSDVKVIQGQLVGAGVELMTVSSIDPIVVEVQVLEGEVGHIRKGARVRVTFNAIPDTTFVGQVQEINPIVTGDTRTARVTVSVPNPQHRLLPGMYARVRIDSDHYPNRLLIPISSVLFSDTRARVFLAKNGRAAWRYVTLGKQNDEYYEVIVSGPLWDPQTDSVVVGDTVLTANQINLTHGAKIRLVQDVRKVGGRRN